MTKSPTQDETHYTLISTVHVPISSQHATAQENFHGKWIRMNMQPHTNNIGVSGLDARNKHATIVLVMLGSGCAKHTSQLMFWK